MIIVIFKRHYFLTQSDVFWRILRKNPFKGVGCSLIEEPKQRTKNASSQRHCKITYLRSEKPLNRSLQNFVCRVPSRT